MNIPAVLLIFVVKKICMDKRTKELGLYGLEIYPA